MRANLLRLDLFVFHSCLAQRNQGGVLVFFPSYSLLEACLDRWAAQMGGSRGDGGKGRGRVWSARWGKGGKGKGKGGKDNGGGGGGWEAVVERLTRKRVFVERRYAGGDAFAATVTLGGVGLLVTAAYACVLV